MIKNNNIRNLFFPKYCMVTQMVVEGNNYLQQCTCGGRVALGLSRALVGALRAGRLSGARYMRGALHPAAP